MTQTEVLNERQTLFGRIQNWSGQTGCWSGLFNATELQKQAGDFWRSLRAGFRMDSHGQASSHWKVLGDIYENDLMQTVKALTYYAQAQYNSGNWPFLSTVTMAIDTVSTTNKGICPHPENNIRRVKIRNDLSCVRELWPRLEKFRQTTLQLANAIFANKWT